MLVDEEKTRYPSDSIAFPNVRITCPNIPGFIPPLPPDQRARVFAPVVNRNRKQLDPILPLWTLLPQLLQPIEALDARSAPSRPEFNENHYAPEVGELSPRGSAVRETNKVYVWSLGSIRQHCAVAFKFFDLAANQADAAGVILTHSSRNYCQPNQGSHLPSY